MTIRTTSPSHSTDQDRAPARRIASPRSLHKAMSSSAIAADRSAGGCSPAAAIAASHHCPIAAPPRPRSSPRPTARSSPSLTTRLRAHHRRPADLLVIGCGCRFCRHAGPPIRAASRFPRPGPAARPAVAPADPGNGTRAGAPARPSCHRLRAGDRAGRRRPLRPAHPARRLEAAAPPEVFWGARDAITADPHGHGTGLTSPTEESRRT